MIRRVLGAVIGAVLALFVMTTGFVTARSVPFGQVVTYACDYRTHHLGLSEQPGVPRPGSQRLGQCRCRPSVRWLLCRDRRDRVPTRSRSRSRLFRLSGPSLNTTTPTKQSRPPSAAQQEQASASPSPPSSTASKALAGRFSTKHSTKPTKPPQRQHPPSSVARTAWSCRRVEVGWCQASNRPGCRRHQRVRPGCSTRCRMAHLFG